MSSLKKWLGKLIQNDKSEIGEKDTFSINNLPEDGSDYFLASNESLEIPALVKDGYFFSECNKPTAIDCNEYNTLSSVESKDKISPLLGNKYSLEDFTQKELIGTGYYGKVYSAYCKKDDKKYALKCLKKSRIREEKDKEHLNYEQKILEIVNHPFIVELKSVFQTDRKVYIVTEYYSGGELFHHLKNMNVFSHQLTKFYFAQIVLAIDFLHNKKIMYRDLKPENIVLDENGYLKLIDFGLAKDNTAEDSLTKTFCGTNEYLAPEVILGESYGQPIDVWGLGILLYEMLYGTPPFFELNKDKLYKKIMFADPDFKFKNITIKEEARDLISKLLDKNQNTRIKARQIRQHNYFQNFDFEALMNKTMKPPSQPCLAGSNSNHSTAENEDYFNIQDS